MNSLNANNNFIPTDQARVNIQKETRSVSNFQLPIFRWLGNQGNANLNLLERVIKKISQFIYLIFMPENYIVALQSKMTKDKQEKNELESLKNPENFGMGAQFLEEVVAKSIVQMASNQYSIDDQVVKSRYLLKEIFSDQVYSMPDSLISKIARGLIDSNQKQLEYNYSNIELKTFMRLSRGESLTITKQTLQRYTDIYRAHVMPIADFLGYEKGSSEEKELAAEIFAEAKDIFSFPG